MNRSDITKIQRVMDANFNRAKEGLRVCEDFCRFVLDNAKLTSDLKHIRHQLQTVICECGAESLLQCRDISGDVGRQTIESEKRRAVFDHVFYANAQRVKESLRVLEEFSKFLFPDTAQKIKKMRYKFYDIEKRASEQF